MTKDPLSTFLLVASFVIAVTFFVMLGGSVPTPAAEQVDLSTVQRLIDQQRVRDAVRLDYDHQIQVDTDTGLQLYADYQASDAGTQTLMAALNRSGADYRVDLQAGKAAALDRDPVPAADPAARLPVRLLHAPDRPTASGGIGAFSAFRGKGKKKQQEAERARSRSPSVAGEPARRSPS